MKVENQYEEKNHSNEHNTIKTKVLNEENNLRLPKKQYAFVIGKLLNY